MSGTMKIQVVAFASAAEALGSEATTVELPTDARLGDLAARLHGQHPRLAALWPRLALAVDGTLVQDDTTALTDGMEVALLPPVSGGAPAVPHGTLVEGPIDIAAVERSVADATCGAVLLFLGRVRNHHGTRPVTGLTYQAYRPMATRALQRIVEGLEQAQDGLRAAIVHRVGPVGVGEASVVIAIASPHRAAAYEASRAALEQLKREVPIWKREHYADGDAVWREEEPLSPPAPSRPVPQPTPVMSPGREG